MWWVDTRIHYGYCRPFSRTTVHVTHVQILPFLTPRMRRRYGSLCRTTLFNVCTIEQRFTTHYSISCYGSTPLLPLLVSVQSTPWPVHRWSLILLRCHVCQWHNTTIKLPQHLQHYSIVVYPFHCRTAYMVILLPLTSITETRPILFLMMCTMVQTFFVVIVVMHQSMVIMHNPHIFFFRLYYRHRSSYSCRLLPHHHHHHYLGCNQKVMSKWS